jgi:hypothetical protein
VPASYEGAPVYTMSYGIFLAMKGRSECLPKWDAVVFDETLGGSVTQSLGPQEPPRPQE